MFVPYPGLPIPIHVLGDVSAFVIEVTAADIAGGTAYHRVGIDATGACSIFWGDDAYTSISSGSQVLSHTYAGAGHYLIQIKGAHVRFYHGSSSGTSAKVIEAVKLYSGLTSVNRTFASCNNSKFKFHSSFRIHSGIRSLQNFCFQAVYNSSDISNIFPDWPDGATIDFSSAFYENLAIIGTVPPEKLWLRTGITFFPTTTAFYRATLLANYASIPAGWK